MNEALKRAVKKSLSIFGLELKRKAEPSIDEYHQPSGRTSLEGALRQFSRLGFQPCTVIDVGVASQTEELYQAFPKANILLIEPLVEFEAALKGICKRYKAQYILAAAGEAKGMATLNVHTQHLDSSSLFKEAEGPSVDGAPREVSVITIDEVCSEKRLSGPYLIKIDVQGAELKVLAGAARTLKHVEVVILEVMLFHFLIGGPQVSDIIAYMKERGFVLYDAWGFLYRPYDNALSQLDMAFVRENGAFRRSHVFATPEQRKQRANTLGSQRR